MNIKIKTDEQKEKPIYFYVANLGSEIQRVLSWKEKGDKIAMQNAYQRVVAIFETIKNFGNPNANIEMDILKKYLDDAVSGTDQTSINRNQISSYFNPFALRVVNHL